MGTNTLIAVLFGSILATAFILFVYFRNDKVFAYRSKLSLQILAADLKESRNGNGSATNDNRRREALQSVSYNKMVLQFWRPLNSFYNEQDFS